MYCVTRCQKVGILLREFGELRGDGRYFLGVFLVTIFPICLDVQVLGFFAQLWHRVCQKCVTIDEDLPQGYRPSDVLRSTLKTRQISQRL